MADGHHLEKCIWRHNSARSGPICTKFGTQMQNDISMTNKCLKSKPEVKIQYGSRLYFETKSSFNSAKKWRISTKFGMQNSL